MTGGDQDIVDVLVVDDEVEVRRSFAEILRTAGYVLAEVEDGFAALESLHSATVRMMVLDMNMPVLDGLKLLNQLDDPPPVVLVTAEEYDTMAMTSRSNVLSWLQKPALPAELLSAVEPAITGRTETK